MLKLERGVDIWVRPCSHQSEYTREFLAVKGARAVLIILVEECSDLSWFEDAPEFVEGFPEGLDANTALILKVEVLEGFHNRPPFILPLTSLLPNLLVDDVLEILQTFWRDILLLCCYSPCVENQINKVILLLAWERRINIGVIFQELSFGDELAVGTIELSTRGR